MADYHNYTELMDELDSLVGEFPDLARLYSLGQTHEDRDLAVIQITKGVNEVKYALDFPYPIPSMLFLYVEISLMRTMGLARPQLMRLSIETFCTDQDLKSGCY